MNRWTLTLALAALTILLLTTSCDGSKRGRRQRRGTSCGAPSILTSSQRVQAVKDHNLFRSQEYASNMLTLVWNGEIADVAQAWANQCQWAHGMTNDCSGNYIGQNLFFISSSNGYPQLNLTFAVELWKNERNYWNFTSGTCQPGKICGHWTQVVWARTTEVGCGYAYCPNNTIILVCDYRKGGNIVGESAFERGAQCTNCDSDRQGGGYKCVNNLCERCSPEGDPSCTCSTTLTCENGGTWSEDTCSCHCPASHYGVLCEKPCSCEDVWPVYGCEQNLDLCYVEAYKQFMMENCMKTCKFPCVRPESCTSSK